MLEFTLKDCEKGLDDRLLRARLGGGITGKMGSFLGGKPRSAWCSEIYIRRMYNLVNVTGPQADED
jgi:hypothetical protein